jgi:LysM repeat protein
MRRSGRAVGELIVKNLFSCPIAPGEGFGYDAFMLSVVRWSWLLFCCLALSGCWPSSTAPLDEQKESNFLAGKARVQDRDFDGAIEAFEKALEVNPHSASAHFELAVIHDQQKNDYATALYHYEKARRLRPTAYPADIARDRLEVCKRELAKTVTQTPTMEYMQREIDRMMLENQRLRQTVIEWQNYYHGRSTVMPALTSNLTVSGGLAPGTSAPVVVVRSASNAVSDGGNVRANPQGPAAAGQRSYKVVAGDNPAKIAARYGIKVAALRAANPGLDDRRLRVGQTLIIPGQ